MFKMAIHTEVQTTVTVHDDLTGAEFANGDGRTVPFSFEGVDYEIDLNNKNAEAFEKAVKKYRDAARVVTGRRVSGPAREDLAQVREWARAHGHSVKDRGRVSAEILSAYDADQQNVNENRSVPAES
jgi:hypothetical protein